MLKTNKWKMNRAGLVNFWYYDDEIFEFANGKLLLRGSNGSGKSVTMQSFLPVLLDGRKSPDRLDPFGSKARKMEDYLLGEKEVVDRDERTGYLFIEYKREDTNQYITTGIGLQAKRHKPMKFWGFVITDNRRIGEDFLLYKEEKQGGAKQRIPFSKIELENRIADGGHVVQTQKEYMSLVNRYIFGFETIEAYEDLIKLLIQLRSPKLSKDFKPTVIYEILEAALPPLSDEDLRHLSDTIEHMDQTKQQLEQLDRELEALTKLNKAYDTYNKRKLAEQADEFIKADRKMKKETNLYNEKVEKQEELKRSIHDLEEKKQSFEREQDTYEKKKDRLEQHEVWNLEQTLQQEQSRLQKTHEKWKQKDEKLTVVKKKEVDARSEADRFEQSVEETNHTIQDHLIDLRNDAESGSFTDHELNEQDYHRLQDTRFDFTLWKKQIGEHVEKLEAIEEQMRTYDDLKVQYQNKNKEIGDVQEKKEGAEHEKEDWKRIFEEDKQAKLNEIFAWAEQHPEFELEDGQLQRTSRDLYQLYEQNSYRDIERPFQEAQADLEQRLRKQLSQQEYELDTVKNSINNKQKELTDWKETNDPEPDRDEQTVVSRQKLTQEKVAHIPFYAAVEFHDYVSFEARTRIESALTEMGLLDALIMEEPRTLMHDKAIVQNPNTMAYTLADYLKPDPEVEATLSLSVVDDVLRSILVSNEEGRASVREDGSYQIGILTGHAVELPDARFIGRTARKRYRLQKIEGLENEIDELEREKERLKEIVRSLAGDIESSKEAIAKFPNDEDLHEGYQSIKRKQLELDHYDAQLSSFNDELRTILEKYQSVKQTLSQQTMSYNIEKTRFAYKEAIDVMRRYEKDVSQLELYHHQFLNAVENLKRTKERIDELSDEVDEIRGEVNEYVDILERLKLNIQEVKAQLEREGAEDIRQQIQEVQLQLSRVKTELEEVNFHLPSKTTQLENNEHDVARQQIQKDFFKDLTTSWEATFLQEVRYGFVSVEESEEAPLQLAKAVMKSFGHLLKEKEAGQVSEQVTKMFYQVQTDLMEYRMKEYTKEVPTHDWMKHLPSDDQFVHIDNWKRKASRRIIELDYFGKQVNPGYVREELSLEQTRQQGRLDDKDRELYEEILFKSVGNKLRSRIQRAEKWTKKMNALMESRNSSSGLTFSIRWKPRTADSEEEMDTRDLVELLKRDAKTLKDEDLDRIIEHFRSKISKAKETIQEKGEGQTLLQVLKEVLDYRNWFSFVLSYRRPNEEKKELTNNAFYKFSGGEKAMAMYIPLFTACYSRYQEAESHAPHIITLDEAFAGVDENNIREMFEIVEQLGFDYMMNSQVLWGDYDTISELSIYELVRPQNADFVTLIHYLWDGEKIGVSLPGEDEEETLV